MTTVSNERLQRLMIVLVFCACVTCSAEVLRYHTLVVDGQDKILPWFTPASGAFDNYLDQCWAWAVAAPNDAHGLPISYLYCAWNPGNPPTANTGWENDVGEKIPNWVESARLYYQYAGNRAPLDYVKGLVDYSLDHGQTPTTHAWPAFPVGTSNAGDTEFRGFTDIWDLWDCHVDLAADTGFAMYRMYQMYGDARYRDKAIHVADVLVANMVPGNATDSPWPYVINSQSGANTSRYAASWDGALQLFDLLIENGHGSVSNYASARAALKNWLLTYPMQNGNWVDAHSDIQINGTNNWSTTCASDMCLYLLDNPSWDPDFLTDVPKLLEWSEDNFVNVNTPDGLPGQYHGAYVPGEQTAYMYRMGYQAARLGAQYAQWYAVSGDSAYKDRAYRCLSYNTYMMQSSGQSSDGPTDTVGFWWSDCYGEATRMYYYGLAAVPEWAPDDENHLLHSSSIVTAVTYGTHGIAYETHDAAAIELLRLFQAPTNVLAGGVALPQRADLTQPGWTWDAAGGLLRIRHDTTNQVQIAFNVPPEPPMVSLTGPTSESVYASPGLILLTATATGQGGVVTNVEFFSGADKIGEDSSAPYGFIWANVPIGSYTLTARTTDNLGLTGTSVPVVVMVTAPGGSAILGNQNEGNTTDYLASSSYEYIKGSRFQAAATQPLSAIHAKVYAISGKYKCAIYADQGGTASILLRSTSEVVATTTGWHPFPLTSPLTVTSGTYYWLAIWSDDAGARVYADDNGAGRRRRYAYGTWPDPINLSYVGAFTYCIYATGPSLSVFDQWKANYGLPPSTPATSDDDLDGLALLLEYVLGVDPTAVSVVGLPTAAVSNGHLALTYSKIKAATDVEVSAAVAGTVDGVYSSSEAEVEQHWQVTEDVTTETITARDKTGGAPSRFMRLNVTQL